MLRTVCANSTHDYKGCSEISSWLGSQYSLFPLQYDCAAMMHTMECENPWSTVALGSLRVRMAVSQSIMWTTSSSSGPKELGGAASETFTVVAASRAGPTSGTFV